MSSFATKFSFSDKERQSQMYFICAASLILTRYKNLNRSKSPNSGGGFPVTQKRGHQAPAPCAVAGPSAGEGAAMETALSCRYLRGYSLV